MTTPAAPSFHVPAGSRRLAEMRIGLASLPLWFGSEPKRYLVTEGALPPDTRVVDCRMSGDGFTFTLILESEGFDWVAPGTTVPERRVCSRGEMDIAGQIQPETAGATAADDDNSMYERVPVDEATWTNAEYDAVLTARWILGRFRPERNDVGVHAFAATLTASPARPERIVTITFQGDYRGEPFTVTQEVLPSLLEDTAAVVERMLVRRLDAAIQHFLAERIAS